MRGRIIVDLDAAEVTVEGADGSEVHDLGSAEGFAAVSRAWLRSGWDAKHVYGFTWLGRPIIQLPEDIVRLQELVFTVQPDVIVETGVAHGGSLVLWASLLKALDRGRVIGVDVEIRPHNRAAIENHKLSPLITLIEGDSTDEQTVAAVRRQIKPGQTVLVILDSNHTKAHVTAELEAYAPLVSVGSYLVAMDGLMEELVGAPRSNADWAWDNPNRAVAEFVAADHRFEIAEPEFLFNEGSVAGRVSYAPAGIVQRVG